jgi:lipopolysaccharide export LptBFGC system permease protein LptF
MYTIILSAVIIGVFMVCASIILGRYILRISENSETGVYQMIKIDEKNIVILDTRTGQYWKKPIVENSSLKTTDKETDNYA